MTRFFKTAAFSLVGAGLIASPAIAGETKQEVAIAFTYNEAATVEDNYKELRSQVRRACSSNSFIVSSFYGREARRECRVQLMDKAVAATSQPEMIAMHTGSDASKAARVASR